MEFLFGKCDFIDEATGQENCYLLTNGLGGYSSLTLAGSCTRNDHALLMASVHAPTGRVHLISKVEENLYIEGDNYPLYTQDYANLTKNVRGCHYLNQAAVDGVPTWNYQVKGVEVEKVLVMKQGSNTLGVRYEIRNGMKTQISFLGTPQMQFVHKGAMLRRDQKFVTDEEKISSNGFTLFYKTNGNITIYEQNMTGDLYYKRDAVDGRDAVGRTVANHTIRLDIAAGEQKVLYVIYSTEAVTDTVEELLTQNQIYRDSLLESAGLKNEVAKQLVYSASQFLVKRDSTGEMSLMAGYPFFGDWGRDTMIAVVGCCISTGRYEEAKSIFRSFMKYCHKGIMPNMFPESGEEPSYNTVDASLLFIGGVYEYYKKTQDIFFLKEAWPVMKDIIYWYKKGTDFHIFMDEDGLIQAGADLEQVTWMDIRFEDILPTPRHGKPVEVNAYWYNDLKIMEELAVICGDQGAEYGTLAKQVKESFLEKFWSVTQGCLRDVVSGKPEDEQIRCNQIWAVSQPYCMLEEKQAKQVLDKVYERLYTPYGLRTLDPADPQFQPVYQGGQFDRDMSYHQGTVWPFPMGAYYLAYLKVNGYNEASRERVKKQLKIMSAILAEGCVGQLPEVYDGAFPGSSKGCFAQGWSVGEVLRVYEALEHM